MTKKLSSTEKWFLKWKKYYLPDYSSSLEMVVLGSRRKAQNHGNPNAIPPKCRNK